MKTKQKLSILYSLVCLIIFVFSMQMNRSYFNQIAYDSVYWYQIKQVLSVLLLYLFGYLLLKALQDYFSDLWIALLSFPTGTIMWGLIGQLVLMLSVPYTMSVMLTVIGVVIIFSCIVKRQQKIEGSGVLPAGIGSGVLVVTGTALLVCTGWNYINMNYDSYVYFTSYGQAIAQMGEYEAWNTQNAFVITNIGQFLPILNSYSALWGLDYSLPILSFLNINVLVVWAYMLHRKMKNHFNKKNSIKYTILFTLLYLSCTCLLVFSNWMLSNAFIMYYLTIMIILGELQPEKFKIDFMVLICICGVAITMLRKDGLIVVCFVFVCFCCRKILKPKECTLLLLPSLLAQLGYIWYVRVYLQSDTSLAVGTSLMSNKSILMLLAVCGASVVFIMWIYRFADRLLSEKIWICLTAFFLLAVIVAICIKPGPSFDHLDAIVRILFSSAYGLSIFMWGVMLSIIGSKKIKVDYYFFLIAGYCMLVFLIYWNKGNREQGIDNSGMRAFVQIVPAALYVGAIKILDSLTKDEIVPGYKIQDRMDEKSHE